MIGAFFSFGKSILVKKPRKHGRRAAIFFIVLILIFNLLTADSRNSQDEGDLR